MPFFNKKRIFEKIKFKTVKAKNSPFKMNCGRELYDFFFMKLQQFKYWQSFGQNSEVP